MTDALKPREWQSSIIWVIGLIFICGMTYNNQKGMREDVTVNRADIKENRTMIHEGQLTQTEINTKLSAIPKIERDLEKLTEHLMKFDYHKLKEDK